MKKSKLLIMVSSGVIVVVLAIVLVLASSSPPSSPSSPSDSSNSLSTAIKAFQPPNAAYAANSDSGGSRGDINVSGAGTINVNPDVAYISLGVNTKGTDPKAALEENNRIIAAVISAVREKDVAEKDIRTTDFNIYPDYNYGYDKYEEQVRGYTVSNNVSIVIRNIAAVGDVLGAAANAGANAYSGVQFGLLDNSAAYNEALELALKNAIGKAEAIAGALGKRLGSPSSVTETINYYSPYHAAAENLSVDAAVGSVPVQTGKLTVTANVQMVYEFAK